MFPAYEIDKDSGELFDAMRVAVEKRLVIGLKEQTGWSLAHMANIYARLKDGVGAKKCLDLLLRFCTGPNLFTYHNDWRNMGVTLKYMHAGKAPFQIDANMGFTAAVYEMLLFSSPNGKLEILPALPADWESGEISGLSTQIGARVSIKWSDQSAQASIFAERECNFEISSKAYPNVNCLGSCEGATGVHLKAGEEITIKFTK